VKELIGEFDGNARNYDAWEKQIKLVRKCSLDDLKMKTIICNKLRGKSLKWYYSRTDCIELSVEDLLKELRKIFDLRLNKLQLRREFGERKWKSFETFIDYLYDKITMGNLVSISEDELSNYLVDGISDSSLQSQARIQSE